MKPLLAAFALLAVASHGETGVPAGWFLQHERSVEDRGDGKSSRCIAVAPMQHLAVTQTERNFATWA